MIIKNLTIKHHSFLVSLEGKATQEEVLEALKVQAENLFEKGPTLVQKFLTDSFSIELAREVKAAQDNRTVKDEHRFIFIGFSSITPQAQNALLKVLEEPSKNTYFFILSPNRSLILDTVRSRCVDLEICPSEDEEARLQESFLAKNSKERLEIVKKLLSERSLVDSFYSNLEQEIARLKDRREFSSKKMRQLLSKSKYYAQSGSPAAKYLLEELALSLPHS